MAFTRIGVGGVGRTYNISVGVTVNELIGVATMQPFVGKALGLHLDIVEIITSASWAQWVGKALGLHSDVTENITGAVWAQWVGKAFTSTGDLSFDNILRHTLHTIKRLIGFVVSNIDRDG